MFGILSDYYKLTKPGIIRGNAVHVLAGALLASTAGIDWQAIIAVLIGTSLVIASACVANNYMDRKMDAKMERTKDRASVTGRVPVLAAMIFMLLLLAAGFWVLYSYTNMTVVVIGVAAYLLYVFAYGWAKRHTVHSTLVGAIPGALPAMAGYVAADGGLSVGAALVFFIVFAWQMPHFYAISLFRRKEYKRAGVPVLGVVRPFLVVRRYIFAYICLYLIAIIAMISLRVIGAPAGLLLLAGAAFWIVVFRRTSVNDEAKWAKSVFGASLVLTLALLGASILNVFVPPYM